MFFIQLAILYTVVTPWYVHSISQRVAQRDIVTEEEDDAGGAERTDGDR